MGTQPRGTVRHLAAVLGFLLLVLPSAPAHAECGMVGALLDTCEDDPKPPKPPKRSKAEIAEDRLLTFLNEDRRGAGVRTLSPSGPARRLAREHARAMMRRGRAFHNPSLGSTESRRRLGYPGALGENVGFGPRSGGVHAAFMRSAGHRANALAGWYDQVGIGAVYDGRTYWVVEVFIGNVGSGPRRGSVSLPSDGARRKKPAARAALPLLPADEPFTLGVTSAADPVPHGLPWPLMSGTIVGLAIPGVARYVRNRRRALRA